MTIIDEPNTVHYAAAPADRVDDWRNWAACRNADPEIFFAVGVGLGAERATAEAKSICARCDVIEQCGSFFNLLQQTLPGSPEGVWAGTSDADRNREARRGEAARLRARRQERKQAAA